jgi:uncharacterized protein YdeI (BOF family)
MTDKIDKILHKPRRTLMLAAAGLLAVGGAAGAVAVQNTRPSVTMAPATPVAIRSLSSEGIVTVKGQVAEIYGNKFIMADGTGRALVDAGREGEGGTLVTVGEPVTVQGRFDRGFIRAAFLVAPGGKVTSLAPLDGPGGPHGRHGPGGPGGPGGPDDRGPGGPRGDGPPPPPPVASAATPQGAATPAPAAAPAPAATPAPAGG